VIASKSPTRFAQSYALCAKHEEKINAMPHESWR
jgi:hypothetical protein